MMASKPQSAPLTLMDLLHCQIRHLFPRHRGAARRKVAHFLPNMMAWDSSRVTAWT